VPISQTPVVSGTEISRSILDVNLQAVESYLRGRITGADLAAQIGVSSRVDGENLVNFTPPGFEMGIPAEWSRRRDDLNQRLDLDSEAILDFLYYGEPEERRVFINTGPGLEGNEPGYPDDILHWGQMVGSSNLDSGQDQLSRFVYERLGTIPAPLKAAPELPSTILSWNNWRWNMARPPSPQVEWGPEYQDRKNVRFPPSEYWDTWKTVPYASAKIYVPGPCQLVVNGYARGTWNCVSHRDGLEDNGDRRFTWRDNLLDYWRNKQDPPTVFRLFIDQAHDPENRVFRWKSNGHEYESNWAPVQPEPEVGLGLRGGWPNEIRENVGREFFSSTWPRGTVRAVSEIFVPEAGYYNISLRYNSLHFFGHSGDDGFGGPKWIEATTAVGPDLPAFGLNLVSRFEAAGIQAVGQLKRTGTADSSLDAQFLP